jgi:hypothetical protein
MASDGWYWLGDIGFPPEEQFVVSRPGSSIRVAPGSLESGLTAEWPSIQGVSSKATLPALPGSE